MTAQTHETISYNGELYAINLINGAKLFSLKDFEFTGFSHLDFSTACYRGYVCSYSVNDSQVLCLDSILVHGHLENGGIARISIRNGAELAAQVDHLSVLTKFSNLSEKMKFTGSMIIGKGIVDYNKRSIFNNFWNCHKIYELVFKNGDLCFANELSSQALTLRYEINQLDCNLKNDFSEDEFEDYSRKSECIVEEWCIMHFFQSYQKLSVFD